MLLEKLLVVLDPACVRSCSFDEGQKLRTVYDSKSKAEKARASEFDLDPNDNFAWYRIVKLSSYRFEQIGV